MKRSLVAGITVVALTAVGCAVPEQQSRAPGDFTLDELLAVSSLVGDAVPDWAPDGSRIAVVGGGQLRTGQIRILDVETGALTKLPVRNPAGPKYSPDGRWLAYTAPGSVGGTELWLWSLAEQRALQLTDLGVRLNSWRWSPDGSRIAFSSMLRGAFDIYTVEVRDGAIKRLTADTCYEVQPSWTPDGRTILFVRLDEFWRDHEVIAIDANTGGGARTVVRDTDFFDYAIGAEFGPAQVSPRGDLVLFRSHRSGWLNWWLVPLAGGEPWQLAAEEADQSSQKPFRGYAQWSPDGQHVLYTSNLNGTHVLRVASVDGGEPRTLVVPELGIAANPTWSPDGRRIAYTLTDPRRPMDLYVMDLETGEVTRLTRSLEDESLAGALFVPQKVSYPSTDGFTIQAYLYRPTTSPPPGGHPAIVWVHGGPTSQFDDSWRRHWSLSPGWQPHYLVKHGYAVLEPNVRGSSGYGLEFEKANAGCWGHCDMEDVVAGVDYLESLPDISGERVGVAGTSYGGYMTIAATTFGGGVFRAAAALVSGYSDRVRWAEDIYDIRGINLMAYDLGPVEENRETYIYVSPFYHARDMDTPLLIVGDVGLTPMRPFADEAARYFKPVRYEAYADVGSAENRRVWLPRVIAFFDRHLRADLQMRPPGSER